MTIKAVTLFLAFFIFILIIELVREQKLTFKYAFGWLVTSVIAILLSFFDRVLFDAAFFFGFELPSNFIFFSLIGILMFLSIIMTVFLCQQDNCNKIIAQKLAIIESELNKLKEKK